MNTSDIMFIMLGVSAVLMIAAPIVGLALLFIILARDKGLIKGRKDLKDLTIIAGKGIFSPWYYIGKDGIYKDKKLFLRWDEIDDIYVLNEYYESRTYPILRTLEAGAIPTRTVPMGTLRIFTKDGRQIDIKNVVNPKEISEYIRKVYLKKP